MKKNSLSKLDGGQSKLSGILQFLRFSITQPGRKVLLSALKKIAHRSGFMKPTPPDYNKWIRSVQNQGQLKAAYNEQQKGCNYLPKISVIVTGVNNKEELHKTIVSVDAQLYSNWEVCIRNTSKLAIIDSEWGDKIKYAVAEQSGKVYAITAAIEKACGDYLLFLKSGTTLTPNCLSEFVYRLNTEGREGVIYADEDMVGSDGTYQNHYFKPDWSPDTILARNYIGDHYLINRELLIEMGGVRRDFGDVALFDLLLRVADNHDIKKGNSSVNTYQAVNKKYAIGHVGKVLFHMPEGNDETDLTLNVKAIEDALKRRGIKAGVTADVEEVTWQINYDLKNEDLVSIIIPTKDQVGLLKKALESIIEKTAYKQYEIIVINNNSTTEAFFDLMKECTSMLPGRFRCVDAAYPFNFSKLMNLGAAVAKGKYLLLLNNDVEIIQSDWLAKMLGQAQQAHTGAVGVKLLYPNNTIQHAGIVLGIDGHTGHAFAHRNGEASGYHNNIATTTNYSAVTAACLMVSKEKYNEVGGMDEGLPVEYNDVDLCLSLMSRGYYNVYLSSVSLYHYESATRGHPFRSSKSYKQHEHDLQVFKNKWQDVIDNDPFYNPNLTRADTSYGIKG